MDFDEYIRQGEPSQKEKAGYWQTAIGLQAVDGLTVSEYLQDTARRHIEGDITIDDARELVNQYYIKKTARDANDEDKEEADRVSSNIVKFDVDNNQLAKHSWYFRNALVRANYRNITKHIEYTPVYLERFFRNLLLGEQWDLRNRYLHIQPTGEWSEQPNLATPSSTPTSTPTSSLVSNLNPNSKLYTNNNTIIELILAIGDDELGIKQIMENKGLKDRKNFIDYHLEPAMKEKFVHRKYPDRPNHPRQKYLLTVKGVALYNELKKGE